MANFNRRMENGRTLRSTGLLQRHWFYHPVETARSSWGPRNIHRTSAPAKARGPIITFHLSFRSRRGMRLNGGVCRIFVRDISLMRAWQFVFGSGDRFFMRRSDDWSCCILGSWSEGYDASTRGWPHDKACSPYQDPTVLTSSRVTMELLPWLSQRWTAIDTGGSQRSIVGGVCRDERTITKRVSRNQMTQCGLSLH